MTSVCTTGGDHTLSIVEAMPDGGQLFECTTCDAPIYVDRLGRRWLQVAGPCAGGGAFVHEGFTDDNGTAVCDCCGQRVETRPDGDRGDRYYIAHLGTAPEPQDTPA